MADEFRDDGSLTAEKLIAHLKHSPTGCFKCGAELCAHRHLMSIVMGFRDKPLCMACLASALEQEVRPMRDHICSYIQRRDCYRGAWEWACAEEGQSVSEIPECLSLPREMK
jgi:hypothetical protein